MPTREPKWDRAPFRRPGQRRASAIDLRPVPTASTIKANKGIGRSDMSDALVKVLRRFEERLARLESEVEAGAKHRKAVHLHKALAALPGDHPAATCISTNWTVPNSPGSIPKWQRARCRRLRRSGPASA